MRKLLSTIILSLCFFCGVGIAQSSRMQSYNYMSFTFADNSEGMGLRSISETLFEETNDELSSLVSNSNDNYFIFFGSNGDEPTISYDANKFNDELIYQKYTNEASEDANPMADRKILREMFVDNPVTIKSRIDCNIFLSAYATRQLLKNCDEMPTPIFFIKELPYLVNATDDVILKINFYVSEDWFNSSSEKDSYTVFVKLVTNYCSKELNTPNIEVTINAK